MPRVDGLYVKDIIKFCHNHIEIETYLPVYKKGRAPDREWLSNLGMTLNYFMFGYSEYTGIQGFSEIY